MNRSSLIGHVVELVEAIDKNSQPADRITSDFFRTRKYLGSHDRRFISESVFGMIRHRRFIEALLEQYIVSNPNAEDLDSPHNRYLPLFVAYSLVAENHFEGKDKEASAILPEIFWRTYFPKIDLQPFVQWVGTNKTLDFPEHDRIVQLGVKYSFQDWMVKEWYEQVGEEIEELLQSFNSPATVTLRVNLLKTSRDECQQRLRDDGIETEKTLLSPSGLVARKRFNLQSSKTFQDGWFELQDEGSQLISLIVNPQPGDIVIDACAGAGGKSLHLAELMHDQGEIIAIDVEKRRLSELHNRAERGGIQCIKPHPRDEIQPEGFFGKADIVLVDAPCTGVGTIRRNPGFKWSVTESLVNHYADVQKAILAFNAPFVKLNGKLMYTTCSLFRKENEDVIQSFLAAHPEYQIMKPEEEIERYGLQMDSSFLKLFPHRHRTDGFFVTAMKRIC